MKKTVCVLGGDLRQETVYNLLVEDGYNVIKFGLSDEIIDYNQLKICQILILPIPASYDNIYVNAPLCKEKIKIAEIVDVISENCFVLGGCLTYELKALLEKKKLKYYDYYNREELIIKNAIPTVEGAIEIAMSELPITLFGSKSLVVGYGRIGKILADRLKAFGSQVTVSARNHKDFAWIEEKGLTPIHTDRIEKYVNTFDIIFNTVPATVLGKNVLEKVKETALIIDLASKPGGVDFSVAGELGRNVIWALSLPGKTAPITSGKIIKDTIVNILSEMEV